LSSHTLHTEHNEVCFCTVTCYNWLPLFEEAKAYLAVYTWFEHLKKDGCYVLGYVIMPNHLHMLLFPTNSRKLLNNLVGEGKRFMAYGIIKSLEKEGNTAMLKQLAEGVEESERKKGKKHQVFRLSFDARQCFSQKMIEQKLDYIHHNPVRGKWSLVDDFTTYRYSSAGFYEMECTGLWEVVHYKEMDKVMVISESFSSGSE
jgi:REP element-mobilizing transposase RayT